ncbi:MAG TPA: aldehyde dehydrogenase PuuC, partial [Pseudomonas sp.]
MSTPSRTEWEHRASILKIESRAFIHGEYAAAVSGATFDCLSPIDGRLLAQVASCEGADAERAVLDARATFES